MNDFWMVLGFAVTAVSIAVVLICIIGAFLICWLNK